jgi:hypothetical protein
MGPPGYLSPVFQRDGIGASGAPQERQVRIGTCPNTKAESWKRSIPAYAALTLVLWNFAAAQKAPRVGRSSNSFLENLSGAY